MATEDSARIRLPARRISLSLAGSRVRPPSHSMSRRTPSSSAFVYVPGTGKEEDQFLSKWPAPSTTAINRVAKRWPFGFRCNERWRSKVCPVSYVAGYDESGLSLVCNRLTRFGLPFSNRPRLDHHWWDQFQKEFFRRKSAFPNFGTNKSNSASRTRTATRVLSLNLDWWQYFTKPNRQYCTRPFSGSELSAILWFALLQVQPPFHHRDPRSGRLISPPIRFIDI